MLPRPVPHVRLDLLVRHARQVFQVTRHLDCYLSNLCGIVLGVVMHDVLQQTKQYFDAVANQMIVCLLVDVLFLDDIFLCAISI